MIPAVTISATPAVSPVRKREPTLKADRILSSSKAIGCVFLFETHVSRRTLRYCSRQCFEDMLLGPRAPAVTALI